MKQFIFRGSQGIKKLASRKFRPGRLAAFAFFLFFAFLPLNSLIAGSSGPIAALNTTTPYLIYYGNWSTAMVNFARTNYHLVILHPASNISASQIASIRSGPDGVLGTADDVKVLAYLSIGEDDRRGVPLVDDGLGPRVDPRASDSVPLSSITNMLGLPSAGGTGYGSYYLNTRTNQTGRPDENGAFGSYYVNAGAPAWWNVIKNMTKAISGQAGMDEILTTSVGNAYNCDGLFLDTIDTAAPNTWGTEYEWTAPGMQALVQRIHTNYVGKLLMGNRGLFFYDSNLKTYPYCLRPYLDMVMFESYYSDSSTNAITASFLDNKYDFAPKINAEAGRPDGFTVFAIDYDHTPAQSAAVVNQDYVECMEIQGWPLYRTNPSLNEPLNTNAAAWLATNADTQPPVWSSTAAQGPTPPAPRAGVQEVTVGSNSATLYWDIANDQTRPVRYNIYYFAGASMDFSAATRVTNVVPFLPASYTNGTGPGLYPYGYTVTGLSNGTTCFFAIRAGDSATPSHEDTNTVAIAATPGTRGLVGNYATITIDGNFSDWANVPWSYQGAFDSNEVNFAEIQFANDSNYLYGHFKLFSPYRPFSDYYTHLFIDTDNNSQTGYEVSGSLFGAEFMIESGYGYDERNGSFNAGSASNLGWAIAPAVATNEFEFRVSLATQYSGGAPVFNTNSFRILLQDDRGPEIAIATGLPYTLAPALLGPLSISRAGSQITISWSGSGTLQESGALMPGSWTNVPAATSPYIFQAGPSLQFYRLVQ